MSRSVVCISHASGAGGEEIGRLAADRLGFLFVDEELIARAAARGGIDPETVADEERRKSMFAGCSTTWWKTKRRPQRPRGCPHRGTSL